MDNKKICIALLISAFFTSLAAMGLMRIPESVASDALYQSNSALDGDIVIIGIDEKAVVELGAYQDWGRDKIADLIETLNESDDCHPAVIGIDVLYSGNTNEAADEKLAKAAAKYNNVVTACAVNYGDDLKKEENGEYSLDTFAVLGIEYPYDLLRNNTVSGFINIMLDKDGILRHHMLETEVLGGRIPSFALAVANAYSMERNGGQVKLPPVNKRGFWYIPFAGKPFDFDESISVADVLSGEVPADYFADRIVLIGPFAPAFADDYFTSIDHSKKMYGVEIHANVIQALLWGDYKKEVAVSLQLMLLFITAFLMTYFLPKRKVLPSVLVWVFVCTGWIIFCIVMYKVGYIFYVTWIPAAATVIYIACIAYNYISATIEKQKITNTFKRYVDPSVISELLKEESDNLGLGGRLCEIAVLFVDIRGFTTMSEALSAPEVVEILNEYLTLTTKCIMDNHGTLDKFVGDCTMAIWNAPLPQEDYVMKAVKAAMAMVEGAKLLEEKFKERYGRTVSFGIGVNAGQAVVGNIGAPMRMDYTAIGDTVNTAARLEANAPAGTVYISKSVADILGNRIRATSLGDSIKLKGKKEGFEVLILEEIL